MQKLQWSSKHITSIFLLVLIGMVRVPIISAQTLRPLRSAGMPTMTSPTSELGPTPVFTWQIAGARSYVHVPVRALEKDFMVTTRVTAIHGQQDPLLPTLPSPGAQGRSGALRWRRMGDSLVLLQYTHNASAAMRYRRRATVPIVRIATDQALVVDAAPLLAAVPLESSDTHAASAAFRNREPGVMLPAVDAFALAADATVIESKHGVTIDRHVRVRMLPVVPIQPRLYDSRVGYVTTDGTDQDAPFKYIKRLRLEKKDPNAAVSDVVRPVVYIINDKAVPPQWIPVLTRSVETWNPVFESIGFRHALRVILQSDTMARKQADSQTTYISINWAGNNNTENATVATEEDPRTGETIWGDVTLWGGIISHIQRIYFTYSGAADPRMRFPVPDSMTAKLLEMCIAHEIGHTLGLDHNHRAGGAYPTDSLRSPTFVHRSSHAASLMAYSYFNYVAQPDDHVVLDELRSRIGPYDQWAIGWGYRPIPTAHSASEERETLEQWRSAQDTAIYLRASIPTIVNAGLDAADQMDIMGNDMIKTADYAIQNFAFLARLITTEHYEDLHVGSPTLRQEISDRWLLILRHVGDLVGGETPVVPFTSDPSLQTFTPIDSVRQITALRYLIEHVFYGQDPLVWEHVLGKTGTNTAHVPVLFDSITPGWALASSLSSSSWPDRQQSLLGYLTNPERLSRLESQSAKSGVHLLPAVCAELKTFDARLATLPHTQPSDQLDAIREALAVALQVPGACAKYP